MDKFLVQDNDSYYFVVEKIKEMPYYVDFNVYEITGWTKEGEVYSKELYLSGSIKWDGCSNITFQDVHLCGKIWWEFHCKMMIELYEYITAGMEDYNPSVAE
jgi:hypothetical protein